MRDSEGLTVPRRGQQPSTGIHTRSGGRSEKDAEDLRASIIDAAALAFSKRGFAATKIDDVAELLGSTKGLIYYHFKSKGDLFLAVHHDALRMDLAKVSPIASAALAPDRKLFEMLYAHAMLIIDHNPIHRVVVQGVELHLAGATTPSQRCMVEKIIALRDEYQGLFLGVIQEGREHGRLYAEDPRLAVKIVLGAVNWMTMWYKPNASQTDKARQDLARKMTRVAIGGLLPGGDR